MTLLRRRYGRLTVIWEAAATYSAGQRRRMWLCRCDCGAATVVPQQCLVNGDTRSCGCLARQVASEKARAGCRARLTADTFLRREEEQRALREAEWEAWFERHAARTANGRGRVLPPGAHAYAVERADDAGGA